MLDGDILQHAGLGVSDSRRALEQNVESNSTSRLPPPGSNQVSGPVGAVNRAF